MDIHQKNAICAAKWLTEMLILAKKIAGFQTPEWEPCNIITLKFSSNERGCVGTIPLFTYPRGGVTLGLEKTSHSL